MTSSSKNDRLAPPLMHAFREAFRQKDSSKPLDLRDSAGDRIIAGRKSSRSAVNEASLRRELAEDLSALLNTVNLGSAEEIAQFPFVSRSILNYGLTDITSYSVGEAAVDEITDELRLALSGYEPRLIADTVEVRRDPTVDGSQLKLRFLVSAEMHCTPVDIPLEFVAELELDSGKMRIMKL
jgi:type VI secretion system protein ImpF